MNLRNKVTVETEEAKRARETTESIARNIQALAKSVNAVIGGPLKRRTLLVLLANSAGMTQSAVDAVLTALADLEKDWLK